MGIYQSFDRSDNTQGAYIQAKIIRKTDRKIYLRIWNSGNAPAYNVNFYIPKENRICILRSRLDYRILAPGKAFDEYAVADEQPLDEISIVTYWEDEKGNLFSREQKGSTAHFPRVMLG